jgi:protein-S-isoprenylcysteine O-methyltransferase Ste14
MNMDWVCTLIEYLVIVLATTIFGLEHSGISSLRIKESIINRWGKKGYGRIFDVLSISTLFIAFLSMNFWNWFYFITDPSLVQIPLLVIGIILGGIGGIIALRASRVISVSTVADMRSDRNAKLVTDGIYAWVRHPLYLATVLAFGALALLYPFPSVVVFALSMIAYTIIGAILEERKLIIHYGDEYQNYKKHVGFIIPKLRGRQ